MTSDGGGGAGQTEREEARRAGAARVVVVDDEPALLRTLGRMLRAAGYGVATYADPATFLDEAPLAPPCCVVLDVHLPGLDGLGVYERLAALEHPPAVIFMSGGADIRTSVQAMKAGAVDFLEKPFDRKDLLAAVEIALRRARDRHAASEAARAARTLLARLTPREREVCDLVARGLRSKDIAGALGAAVKTVNIHRSRIRAKLGADSAIELARLVDRARDLAG